ncbi:putative serine/threonine/dual specificity protein kinase, catalytic domain-containing protein [Tanacetum coccineum]
MLSRVRHGHLVSLIGYCSEFNEMMVVYEYILGGDLAKRLHKVDGKSIWTPLSWVEHLKICIRAARALDYLHTGTGVKNRIIHRDVKSSNILLDENMAAKVSDLGLSKIGHVDQSCTHVSTNVKGTFGYLDPNYFMTGRLTRKSDVYSFGVVLLEVLCGRPAVDPSLDERGLVGWAQRNIKEGTLNDIIDLNMTGLTLCSRKKIQIIKAFVKIAVKCLQTRPKDRPTMSEVVVDLEAALALQERGEYLVRSRYNNGEQISSSSYSKTGKIMMLSRTLRKILPAKTPVRPALRKSEVGESTFSTMGLIINSWLEGLGDKSARRLTTCGSSGETVSCRISECVGVMFSYAVDCISFWARLKNCFIIFTEFDMICFFHFLSSDVEYPECFGYQIVTRWVRGCYLAILGYPAIGVLLRTLVNEKHTRYFTPRLRHFIRCLGRGGRGSRVSHSDSEPDVISGAGIDEDSSSLVLGTSHCRRYSLAEIQLATNNFDPETIIGKGGFGKVYKGFIDDGGTRTTVAIKRLDCLSRQGASEFWTEVKMLSRVRHGHLVSLIGYCSEFNEMMVVYEYISGGDLAKRLHKVDGKNENMAAKVSDLGLSKIGHVDQSCTHVSTNVKGTFGYLDPNYFITGRLTRKSDVFSFGVVLLEVLCGRPAVDPSLDERGLVGWAQRNIKEGTLNDIIDLNMTGLTLCSRKKIQIIKAFVKIAVKCLQTRPKDRPTMSEVVVDLEAALAFQVHIARPER